MKHDLDPEATRLRFRGTPSRSYEPFLSPRAEHKLGLLHKPTVKCSSKILIVDDDRDLCLGLAIRLRSEYDTYIANDACVGLSMAFREVPDVIILDIGLPDYDGYFLMHGLSETPALAGVPVIILTAGDRFTHEWRCHDLGAKRFFQKPVDNQTLLVAIEQLVG